MIYGSSSPPSVAQFMMPVVISVTVSVLDFISIVVLSRCIRLSCQYKSLAQNLLFCDSLVHLIASASNLYVVIQKDPGHQGIVWNVQITLFLSSAILMYCCLVLVLIFVRLLAVRFPNAYLTRFSPSIVNRIVINIYICITVYIVGILVTTAVGCRAGLETCTVDMDAIFLYFKAISVTLFVLADITVTFVCVYIFKVSLSHASRFRSQYPTARLSTKESRLRLMLHVTTFIVLLLLCLCSSNRYR